MNRKNSIIGILLIGFFTCSVSYSGINKAKGSLLREKVLMNKTKKAQEFKILPILIDFNDISHQRTAEEMQNIFFSTKTFKEDPKNFISIRNFFKEVTDEKFDFIPGSYGVGKWLKMPKKKSVYKNGKLEELVQDVFQILKKLNLNLSEYDQDKDGYFDYIVFVCSGEPEYSTIFWWHAGWSINANYDGIKVGRYNMNGETRQGEKNPPIQTICHEFYHYLGGWDLYSYDRSCTQDSVGPWDIMGSNYKWKSFGLSGFSRSYLGWLDEVVIDQSGTYEINALSTNNPNRLYRINIQGTKEYFLIENRFVIGTDSWWQGIPRQGLIIYHIDGSIQPEHGFNDGPNRHDHFAVWVEDNGNKGAYCLDNKLTEFGPQTNPNSRDYNNESLSEITIKNISKLGIKMTFDVIIKKPQATFEVNPKMFNFGKILTNINLQETITVVNTRKEKIEYTINSPSPLIIFEKKVLKGDNVTFKFKINTSNQTKTIITDYILIKSSAGDVKIPIKFEIVDRIGDFNNDKKINIEDFKLLHEAFGSIVGSNNYNQATDLNLDDRIDLEDLIIFAKNFDK